MATMHGVILGPLTEVYADRIVVGARTLFLRDGEACRYESRHPARPAYSAPRVSWAETLSVINHLASRYFRR
jgi:hypothetical protein